MNELKKDEFKFEVNKKKFGYSKIKTTLLRLLLAIILWLCVSITTQNQYIDDWIIILPFLLPALFIVFPSVLKVLKFIPILFLKLASPKLSFLSKLPLIQFAGVWFIEKNSEVIEFNTKKSIFKFFLSHWFSILILPFSTFLFMLRIIGSYESDTEFNILDIDAFRAGAEDIVYYQTVFATTFFLLFYVSLVWVWEDAELKIFKSRKSSKGDSLETRELWLPSNIIKNLFAVFIGFDIISRYLTGGSGISDINDVIHLVWDFTVGVLYDYFILEAGFIFIVMLVVYYASGTHEYIVNSVRKHIRDRAKKADSLITVRSSQIETINV